MSLEDRLVRIAENHGFRAEKNSNGGIAVWIPWTNLNTRESGFDRFIASSRKELYEILGY